MHKYTQIILDGMTQKQLDHILVTEVTQI